MKFGDIVINHWASENNPIREVFVVGKKHRSGRVNPGPYLEVTDGKGKFWEIGYREETRKKIEIVPQENRIQQLKDRIKKLEILLANEREASEATEDWNNKI